MQALYFSVLVATISVGSTLLSAASKKCPAAVSTTVMTGIQMTVGYVVDVLCTLDVNLDGVSWDDGAKYPKHSKAIIHKFVWYDGFGSETGARS